MWVGLKGAFTPSFCACVYVVPYEWALKVPLHQASMTVSVAPYEWALKAPLHQASTSMTVSVAPYEWALKAPLHQASASMTATWPYLFSLVTWRKLYHWNALNPSVADILVVVADVWSERARTLYDAGTLLHPALHFFYQGWLGFKEMLTSYIFRVGHHFKSCWLLLEVWHITIFYFATMCQMFE